MDDCQRVRTCHIRRATRGEQHEARSQFVAGAVDRRAAARRVRAQGPLIAPPPLPARVAAGEFDTRTRARAAAAHPRRPESAPRRHRRGRRSPRAGYCRASRRSGCSRASRKPRTAAAFPSRACELLAGPQRDRDGAGPRSGPATAAERPLRQRPPGPGAGDDGIGVATLIEVGAILKAEPPPRPVTLLFNEGEEYGLNGAAAFVRARSGSAPGQLVDQRRRPRRLRR